MTELHPARQAAGVGIDKLLQAAGEKEKIDRMAERIRVMYSSGLGDGDPYPKGPPKDVHELYEPILRALSELGATE